PRVDDHAGACASLATPARRDAQGQRRADRGDRYLYWSGNLRCPVSLRMGNTGQNRPVFLFMQRSVAAAREWAKIASIPCKGRAPMTWSWTVSIAALAGVALASLVLASSGPKADEQAAIKLPGAGAEDGQAANTNESKDASPQDDSGATQAEPAAGAGDEKAAAPADATAGATDGKEQEKPDTSAEKKPDTSAEKNKSEEAAPAAPEEKAELKEEGEKAESKEGD